MLRILLHIICYDAWYYVSHIILHKKLQSIHRIHHSTPYDKLNFINGNAGHWFEHLFQGCGNFVHLLFVDFYVNEFIIGSTVICSRSLMRHDDRFSWLMGNHHILHHKYVGYNYGEYWIDKAFGTIYPKEKEYKYGKIYT
jgi:sterol desaturase/sphingolipid hydroxylase (fatty acid hydroxylase superfamily)